MNRRRATDVSTSPNRRNLKRKLLKTLQRKVDTPKDAELTLVVSAAQQTRIPAAKGNPMIPIRRKDFVQTQQRGLNAITHVVQRRTGDERSRVTLNRCTAVYDSRQVAHAYFVLLVAGK